MLLTVLARDRSRNGRSPFTGRFPVLASPQRSGLANASWPNRVQHCCVYGLVFRFRLLSTPPLGRRSYLPLRTGQCSRPEGTFTLLLVRTFRRTSLGPLGRRPQHLRPIGSSLQTATGRALNPRLSRHVRTRETACGPKGQESIAQTLVWGFVPQSGRPDEGADASLSPWRAIVSLDSTIRPLQPELSRDVGWSLAVVAPLFSFRRFQTLTRDSPMRVLRFALATAYRSARPPACEW